MLSFSYNPFSKHVNVDVCGMVNDVGVVGKFISNASINTIYDNIIIESDKKEIGISGIEVGSVHFGH